MKRRTKVAISVFVVAFTVFFFFIPAVPMDVIPCWAGGKGFATLSYVFFSYGEVFVGTRFFWATQSEANCI